MRRIACALVLTALPATAFAQRSPTEPGLTLRIFDIGRPMDHLAPLKPEQTPNVDRRLDQLDLTDAAFGGPDDHFFVEALGYLQVDQAGAYEFELTSDDGARMTIRDDLVIDNDGLHAPTPKRGAAQLKSGLNPFRIVMFENEGGAALSLKWKPPGAAAFALVPPDAFRIEQGVTRVVSPGRKVLLDGREHLRPGDGMPLESVHPGWMIEPLRPQGFEPKVGGMDFLPDGRLVITTFDPKNNGVYRESPNGAAWILTGVIGGTPDTINATKIADGFHDPCGAVVVDGDIYISHRPGIERLRDTDHDGTFETRETFATPWIGDNYHHFSFGLQHLDGWIYGTLSTAIYFDNTMKADNVKGNVVSMNGPNPPNRGTCYRINVKTRQVEFLAGGFRTPNGIGVTPAGDIYITDNQGAWLPGNKLIHVERGRFYGHYNGTQTSVRHPEGGSPSLFSDQPVTPPTVWLPQNEISNSPTTPVLIDSGPFAGQLYVGELTAGGIRRVFLEEVNGEQQGVVFRFTQGLECGVNRLLKGPDGCLYAGGTGADGNWNWRGTQFGLQRLRPNGKTAFEYHAISATPDGFDVRLTRAVAKSWLENPANYTVSEWRYIPTPEYGGPKIDEHRLSVTRAAAAEDRRSVHLTIPGLIAGDVVYLRMDPKSDEGEPMWSTEAWYTLNAIPRGQAHAVAFVPLETHDLGLFADPKNGWTECAGARPQTEHPDRLDIQPGVGCAANGAEGRAPDLYTLAEHGDVEAHLEFMIPKGSNSGIYLQGRYEIQVLDSYGVEHPHYGDCGGIYQRWDETRGQGNEGYEGVPPRVNASRPPGEWQSIDIVFHAPRFDASGRKTASARFDRVVLNGQVIHENVELSGPTRGSLPVEKPFGPLRLQGDHGPVIYRNISLKPIPQPTK